MATGEFVEDFCFRLDRFSVSMTAILFVAADVFKRDEVTSVTKHCEEVVLYFSYRHGNLAWISTWQKSKRPTSGEMVCLCML